MLQQIQAASSSWWRTRTEPGIGSTGILKLLLLKSLRFFEDPDSGTLSWDEAWLRGLLENPKQMHWNAFRFRIGPVPDRRLEIADENGLLIQNEYFVWTGHPTLCGDFASRLLRGHGE